MRNKDKRLLIFDMDGVILDSEPLHEEAEHRILEEFGVCGVDLSWTVGISSYKMWQRFIREFHMAITPEALMERQYASILQMIAERETPASNGLYRLMEYAEGKGKMLAVASSSDSVLVHGVLEHLGIMEKFDAVVCGDQVPEKKPAPYIYEEVLRRTGINANDAITVEDSATGAEAARRAGVMCIGYINPTSGNQDLSGTWKQVHNLEEIMEFL